MKTKQTKIIKERNTEWKRNVMTKNERERWGLARLSKSQSFGV